MNLYTYAAMIKNKEQEQRIMKIVTDIIENDLIHDMTADFYREGINELYSLGEDILANAIYERVLPQLRLVNDVFSKKSEMIELDNGRIIIRELDDNGELL